MLFIGLICAASIGLYLLCIHPLWFVLAGGLILAYYLLTEFDLVSKSEKKDEDDQPKSFITHEERQEQSIKGMIKPNLESDEHYQRLAKAVQKAVHDARKWEAQQNQKSHDESTLS
jgi:hypothetical protein